LKGEAYARANTAPLLSQTALALSVAAATLAICGIYLFLFSSMLIREG
jgi:hypothetical protein